jgi:hypothetical protein
MPAACRIHGFGVSANASRTTLAVKSCGNMMGAVEPGFELYTT